MARVWAIDWQVSSSFRGRNPPASLKREALRFVLVGESAFPGEKSSGLIEAVGFSSFQAVRAGFRGRNPPASLKLTTTTFHLTLTACRFPGEKSSGLIEATFGPRNFRAACIILFPGEKSSGLIEAQRRVLLVLLLARFRGRNPPASLKHTFGETCYGVEYERFRGRNPPASLKLHLVRSFLFEPKHVSGGEILRPH